MASRPFDDREPDVVARVPRPERSRSKSQRQPRSGACTTRVAREAAHALSETTPCRQHKRPCWRTSLRLMEGGGLRTGGGSRDRGRNPRSLQHVPRVSSRGFRKHGDSLPCRCSAGGAELVHAAPTLKAGSQSGKPHCRPQPEPHVSCRGATSRGWRRSQSATASSSRTTRSFTRTGLLR